MTPEGHRPTETAEELAEFRTQLRRFVDREIAPFVDEWEEVGEMPREIYRKVGEMGVLGLGYPEAYGGMPASLTMRSVAIQELARAGCGGVFVCLFTHSIFAQPMLALGSEEQKQRTLPGVFSGEHIAACAITEPSGGSDVANLRTRARREGDEFVIDGEKTFISNGMRADFYVVAVRTGGEGAGGVSMLLVERDRPGFTRTRLRKMGWWSSDTATLHFDGCRVPVANLLGREGAGFRTLMENFNGERLMMADEACAFAEVCYDEAADWARERRTFGVPLVKHQVIRHKLVDMRMQITATRAWIDRCTARMDTGDRSEEFVAELCMLKVMAGRTMQSCADQAVQILGGMGFMRGMRSERIYRDVKAIMIGGGAEDILKELASKKLGL
ncbi:acyl-CoA dehydrogenase [Panacagrimonas perspica]|uniref:Acyl-CoA dehydrogenase n=1 Tax=Panacagrimonas perspica TaxID=381431 RepID=A0A4S3K2T8_9GAMM|nr:acyl-CoA dehydrogenase family protein [Panacagrimonas perspica]TDU28834.1 acyl-CoA dehydrogenase [Panacagrimonas perspica]THD02335.1 acyl-CoA dehydrogenase [Panacagrimonas perspica]